jgi:hypothetical protein
MIEIFKELIEKPENQKRYIIYLLKVIFSIIIASRIYIYLFGSFEIILIGDENFWLDLYGFFINGRVLIVTAIFFFVKYAILETISLISFILLNLSSRLFSIKTGYVLEGSNLRNIFKLYRVLDFGKEKGDSSQPGKNFHFAMNFINGLNKNDLRNKSLEIRNTSIFELFNLFIVFSLVYFIFLNHFHHGIINITICLAFLILVSVLISIEYVFNILESNYESISSSLKLIEQTSITEKFVKKIGIQLPKATTFPKRLSIVNEICINDKRYCICYHIEGSHILKILDLLEKEDGIQKILLITREDLNKEWYNHLNKEIVTVIRFKNEKKFLKKLEMYFFSN